MYFLQFVYLATPGSLSSGSQWVNVRRLVNDLLYLQTVPCPHPAGPLGTGEVLQCPEPAGCSDGNCIGLGQKALLSTRVMWQQL